MLHKLELEGYKYEIISILQEPQRKPGAIVFKVIIKPQICNQHSGFGKHCTLYFNIDLIIVDLIDFLAIHSVHSNLQ